MRASDQLWELRGCPWRNMGIVFMQGEIWTLDKLLIIAHHINNLPSSKETNLFKLTLFVYNDMSGYPP
jgi:hypothetical protein